MQLRNKTQREEFLNNYKAWELWKEVPEIELKFYRFVFQNGTVIIATEYACIKFSDYRCGNFEYKKDTAVNYHLILSESDNFKIGHVEGAHRLFNPSGDTKGTIIKYLTEIKPEVKEND